MAEKRLISISKDETKGLRFIFILYFLCWIGILVPFPLLTVISWFSMGLIGFVLFKILNKLIERSEVN